MQKIAVIRSMKNLFVVLAVLLLSACNERGAISDTAEANNAGTYKVIGVKDGDTVELLKEEKTEIVRLAYIDCPEKSQPFGKRAREFTANLCFGKYVTLVSDGRRDQYKRIVGEIVLNDTLNINKELVKNGYAWHYKRYSDDEAYAELENNARLNRYGLWRDAHPIAPWNWRSAAKGEVPRLN